MAEKLLSRACGADVHAGDVVICEPDGVMGTDGSIPMALDYLQQMQPESADLPGPARAERLVFAFDHYGPGSGDRALALQERARAYAAGTRRSHLRGGRGHRTPADDGAGQGVAGPARRRRRLARRVLWRNAINNGLLAIVADTGQIVEGQRLELHLSGASPELRVSGPPACSIACEPLPDFVLAMRKAGGLVPYLRQYRKLA